MRLQRWWASPHFGTGGLEITQMRKSIKKIQTENCVRNTAATCTYLWMHRAGFFGKHTLNFSRLHAGKGTGMVGVGAGSVAFVVIRVIC